MRSRLETVQMPMPPAQVGGMALESGPVPVPGVRRMGSQAGRVWMPKKAMPPARARGMSPMSTRRTACPS